MIPKKKQGGVTLQGILLCVLTLSTSILGYSYYQQGEKLKALEATSEESGKISPLTFTEIPIFSPKEVNQELEVLQCNDGLYANLLVRYGMFEYDKFKSKKEHCTVNSPFPLGSGMCLPEHLQ